MSRFQRFGPEHLATLALLAAIALALSAVARGRGRAALGVRWGLAGWLSAGVLLALLDALPIHRFDWIEALPLHLCDLAVLIAIVALLTRRPLAFEMLYFWGLTGTVIAAITPDVDVGFPDVRCLSFFGLHGGVAISALVLTLGFGMRPRPRANVRAFLLTNAYAGIAALVNVAWDRNYLYLCAKPSQPSILDGMGPWPWYILAADALAFVLFALLMLPYRSPRAAASPPATAFPNT